MKKYLKYLKYVIKHKYYVAYFCFKNGLYWQGIFHDISKFGWDTFITYANHFYSGKYTEGNSETGYSKPVKTDDPEFDYSWLIHQRTQKHHYQFWILVNEKGILKFISIPDKYWIEMICDWYGASIATGKSNKSNYKENTRKWYLDHNVGNQINSCTRVLIENELGIN